MPKHKQVGVGNSLPEQINSFINAARKGEHNKALGVLKQAENNFQDSELIKAVLDKAGRDKDKDVLAAVTEVFEEYKEKWQPELI